MGERLRGVGLIAVLVLTASVEVRSDCLDGQIQFTTFRGIASVQAAGRSPQSETLNHAGGVSVEVPCGCGEDIALCTAVVSIQVSALGYHAEINGHLAPLPCLSEFGSGGALRIISGSVEAQAIVSNGDVRCTIHGQTMFVNVDENRVVTTPIDFVFDIFPTGQPFTIGSTVGSIVAVHSENGGDLNCFLDVTCEPIPPSGPRIWTNAAGGSYSEAANWNPSCPPVHDSQHSDIAAFSLPGTTFIPVSGNGTAGIWLVSGSKIDFSGSAQVFDALTSLGVANQGELRLSSVATLQSVHSLIGQSGAAESRVEVTGQSDWINSGEIRLGRGTIEVRDHGHIQTEALKVGTGTGNGSATVRVVGQNATINVNNNFVVGEISAGTVEIDQGSLLVGSGITDALVGRSAPGVLNVRGAGPQAGAFGSLDVRRGLAIGIGASGRMTIEREGQALIHENLEINGFGPAPGGEVFVNGQSGSARLMVFRDTVIGANNPQEILVTNGGIFETQGLVIGRGQGPGAADVTIRGVSPSIGSSILRVMDQPGDASGAKSAFVGDSEPGQLNIQEGAFADLGGGLAVGGDQGVVVVSGLSGPPATFSTLRVTGETQVAGSGLIQVDQTGRIESNGDFKIGVTSDPPGGQVTLDIASRLNVNGTLSVGVGGVGLLSVFDVSSAACDTLLVGGNTLGATGTVVVQGNLTRLTVRGNAQVGTDAGHGEILLADSGAVMTIGSTMTIGGPSSSSSGAVVLVDAKIEGTGNILVLRNGSLTGTGTVVVLHPARNGGYVTPGLSPGTLTIDGDYEQLPTGVLVMEFAGSNAGQFDRLIVTGSAALGGRLEVHFRNGFVPADPQAFIQSQNFVQAAGGTTGNYDERIYAFPDIFVDFDNDGDKDLRDVAAFQNCFGRSGAGLLPECARADWENNGVINDVEIRELTSRLNGPDGIACPPGGSCPHAVCDAAVVDNPVCGGLDDSDDDCLRGSCTPLGCVSTFEPFGSPCDDHITCTTRSVCGFGPAEFGCFAQDSADLGHDLCPDHDDGDADCVRDFCDRALGCIPGVEAPGSPCDDRIACTTRSVCGSGPDGTGCLAPGPANLNHALCPDNDLGDADCVRDICDPIQGCIPGVEPFGSPCDDGIVCTEFSECGGKDTAGIECRADDEGFDDSLCGNDDDNDGDCLRRACTAEGCVEENEPDQSPCDDGIPCTDQACFLGQCSSIPEDSNCGEFGDFDTDCAHVYCTLDGCVPGFEPDGSVCFDGSGCTMVDSCSAGQCIGTVSPCGEDNDADENCTHAECDEIEGCIFSAEPDGSSCDDGYGCTTLDHCVGGFCVAGAPIEPACEQQAVCDEDCIRYSCDPVFGCFQDVEPESAPCVEVSCQGKEPFSACSAGGFCECRSQQPPDFGCLP